MSNPLTSRPTLGQFSSIVCFKSVITGMEEALGEKATAIALIAAGRERGKRLAQELDLANVSQEFNVIAAKLNDAIGANGTHLAVIDKIIQEDDIIKVYCSETVCSAGEPQGSNRKCTFTIGVVWGALSEVTGKKLRGTHTESVLRGGTNDVFEFSTIR